jgi:hypothetical protein
MSSTLFMIWRTLLFGLFAGCGWTVLAYGRAFFTTRRLIYLLLGLTWLVMAPMVVWAYVLLAKPGQNNIFLPLMGMLGGMFIRSFSGSPAPSFPEYRSMRDIMLFRPIVPPAPPQEGLFVPQARPQRPRSAAIVALTIGMFGALWALMALIVRLIVWLV